VYEVVVLDDHSSDSSVNVINDTAIGYQRDITLLINEKNSGSVFKQWENGARLSNGEYLWIAEADDVVEFNFLARVMSGDTNFTMAYTDSKQIDENDKHLADDYRYYYDESMCNMLDKPATYSGKKVMEACLSIKNQFMNVSSVVFAKQPVLHCFDKHMSELLEFKVAGDWFVYTQLLTGANAQCKIVGEALNVHRRHSGSVTMKNYDVQLNEIKRIQSFCSKYVNTSEVLQSNYLKEVKNLLKGEI
jgi:glycosyltransferase involved in cell wall biosynthesis